MIDKYNEAGLPAEIEADGFITRAETLERVNASKAKPASECIFPKCEECDKYHGHYCTVPMVVSKQIWLTTESLIARMEKRLTELETLVTDEILGSNKPYIATEEEYRNFTPIQRHWYDKAIDDAMKDAEFIDAMKNLKPSVSDGATVKIVKSTPLKKEANYTWDDYFKEQE